MSDEPRLLHQRSQHGYTPRASEAMTGEPEAVSEAEQRQQTRESARRAAVDELAQVRSARDRIAAVLDELDAAQLDRQARSHLRAMRRQLAQLEVKLSARPQPFDR